MGRLQLDSGYYLDAETSWTSQDLVERPNERHGVAAPQEDPSTMTVNIRHKDEVYGWEVWPHDTVQQLQIFVRNRWGIEPSQQRFQLDGLPICPTLRLGLLGDGAEFQVLCAKQGGGFK